MTLVGLEGGWEVYIGWLESKQYYRALLKVNLWDMAGTKSVEGKNESWINKRQGHEDK